MEGVESLRFICYITAELKLHHSVKRVTMAYVIGNGTLSQRG